MDEWYRIVVPALVLRDLPGERQSARIDFDPLLDLDDIFGIQFWFRTEAFPRGGDTPVLVASLRTADNDAPRDLTLRIHGEQFVAELQNSRVTASGKVPLNQWTQVALTYVRGELRVFCWRPGMPDYIEGEAVKVGNGKYRLSSLRLASEDAATHLFAELWLRIVFVDPASLMEFRERLLIGYNPGLTGYWKLDEGSGDLMIDSSVNGNDGVISGGEYRLDSGLALQIGRVGAYSGPRQWINGRAMAYTGSGHTQWVDIPRLDFENDHLAKLERLRGTSLEAADRDLKGLEAEVAETRARLRDEVSKVEAARGSLQAAEQGKRAQIERRRQEIRTEQQTIAAAIESSQKIHLKDFIVRLQDDLTRGRDRIRREFGRIYGLDTVSMEVKVVPGVAGIGLHLPDPALRVDPARLSTLKLRFRAAPEEEEEEAKWAAVPPLEGSTEDFARRKLSQAGFRVEVVYQETADATSEGRVLTQIYDARDSEAQLGSIVTLVVGQRS
jgi:hypothetical protein